jgi:hypothetical protein
MLDKFAYNPQRIYTLFFKLWDVPLKVQIATLKTEPVVKWIALEDYSDTISLYVCEESKLDYIRKMFGIQIQSVISNKLDIQNQFTGKIYSYTTKLLFDENVVFNCYKIDHDTLIQNELICYGLWNTDLDILLLITERQLFKNNKKISRSAYALISETQNLDEKFLAPLYIDEGVKEDIYVSAQ